MLLLTVLIDPISDELIKVSLRTLGALSTEKICDSYEIRNTKL